MTATVDGTDLGDPSGHSVLPPAYRSGELVGVGGSASVYRATDRRTGDTVAVKVLHSTADPDTAARFAAEVRVLQGLRHPGLAQIVDAGVDHHHPYLVTRFVEGRTLQAALHDGEMDVVEVTRLGTRLASTLAHVHARGIVHRDVKPANILLDDGGLPFLTDFGVSRIVAATQMTETGVVVGTPAYMAPEQVRGVRAGPAADVYALGLVLLEMLTGLREYPGGLVESAVARLHRRPRVPTSLPDPLRALLSAMTEDEPELRPTARDVAARLAAGDDVATRTPALRRVLTVAAMAVAAAVVAVGVFQPWATRVDAAADAPATPVVAEVVIPPSVTAGQARDRTSAGDATRRTVGGPVAADTRTVPVDPARPGSGDSASERSGDSASVRSDDPAPPTGAAREAGSGRAAEARDGRRDAESRTDSAIRGNGRGGDDNQGQDDDEQ